jgi:glycosyltransferase involved in cell wall biosynthesis
MNFSVVIPTLNREKELVECINSVLNQTRLPSEIIIIDDGDLKLSLIEEFKEKILSKGICFLYYKKDHTKERRGLSESKNIGLDLAKNEIVFFLDDDLGLRGNFFEEIIKIWANYKDDEKLIGVGGWIENLRKKSFLERIYDKIFGLSSEIPWDVNDVGFQVWDTNLKKPVKCYYIHGGVSSYKKEKVKELGGFETFLGGRTALEDVEFSLKAKKNGFYFIINPNAKVVHKYSQTIKEKDYLIGFKESQNRKIIFKRYCKQDFFHKIWFFWANLGWILRQFLVGNFSKGLGMLVGFIKKSEIS